MGTLTTFDFEGAPGGSIAGAGIGSPGGTGGSAVYATAEAAYGTTGGQFTAASGSTKTLRFTVVSSKVQGIDLFLRIPAVTPASLAYALATVRHSAGLILSIEYNTTNQITILEAAGGIRTGVPSATVTNSTMYRISLQMSVGVSTNDSSYQVKVYSAGSNWTTQVGTTLNRSAINLGTAAVANLDIGSLATAMATSSMGVDHLRAEDGRTTEFAPPTVGVPTPLLYPQAVRRAVNW